MGFLERARILGIVHRPSPAPGAAVKVKKPWEGDTPIGSSSMETKHAHPTEYAGVMFRSRLEARWAVFFDLVGWKWVYEAGEFNRWIPDFVLLGQTRVWVEVKPAFTFEDTAEARAKIQRSGCPDEVIILGANPFSDGTDLGWWAIEIDGGYYGTLDHTEPIAAGYGRDDGCPDKVDFCSQAGGSYRGRMFNGWKTWQDGPENLRHLWAKAGNAVQWKGHK